MTYVPYANFFRSVLQYCPGVPEAVATDAIRNACIVFCEDSQWLQYTPAALDGVANQASYAFVAPADTIITSIREAWWDNFLIKPQSEEQLAAQCGVEWRTVQGIPRYYTQTDDPTSIRLVPYPVSSTPGSGDLTALVTLRPSRDSLTVDANIYERWLEEIGYGAVARIMSTPAQPYTNMTAASAYAGMFKSGVNKAKIDRNRGLVRAQLTLRPPRII